MLLKILFWLLIAGDLAALGLMFLLGLAAAPSSRTSPLAVAAFMLLVPGLLLAGSVWLFVAAKSNLGRGVGLLLAAGPLLVIVIGTRLTELTRSRHQDANGNFTQFAAGPMQQLELAIGRNDAAAVAALAAGTDLDQRGIGGSGVLVLALRTLQRNPGPPDVLRALVQAGADVNADGAECPLAVAIQVSPQVGIAPAQILLQAGADPNRRTQFGEPIWFAATGVGVDQALLPLLLDAGADLNATSSDGQGALKPAALAQNWSAALLLLQRGADWRPVRFLDGRDFRAMLEGQARIHGDQRGLADVQRFLDDATSGRR